MAPAIELAEHGFEVERAYLERSLITVEKLRRDQCARDIFLCSGLPCKPGNMIKQPDLARTLRMIANKGPDAFYTGEIAKTLVKDLESKGGKIIKMDVSDSQSLKPGIDQIISAEGKNIQQFLYSKRYWFFH